LNKELFCICGGRVGTDGKPQSHGTVCPDCGSFRFDVQTLEDIGKSSPDPAWPQRVVVSFECSTCGRQWNYHEGCPINFNVACKFGGFPHNTFTNVVPRDASQYVVVVEKNT